MIEIFHTVINKWLMILALISFDWKVMALRTESKWGLCSHHHISIQFWLGSGVGGSGVCCLYYTHPLRFKSAKRAVVLWYYEWWNDLLSLETWLIRRYMGLILLNSYVAHIADSILWPSSLKAIVSYLHTPCPFGHHTGKSVHLWEPHQGTGRGFLQNETVEASWHCRRLGWANL